MWLITDDSNNVVGLAMKVLMPKVEMKLFSFAGHQSGVSTDMPLDRTPSDQVQAPRRVPQHAIRSGCVRTGCENT